MTEGYQAPLIHEVHADDRYLLNTLDGEWFEILHHFPWVDYRDHAAAYYDALYAFNSDEREAAQRVDESTPETEAAAKQRLLFDRPTLASGQAPPPQRLSIKARSSNTPFLKSILSHWRRGSCRYA